MKSTYDVISLILFAGLAILFLQRSAAKERDEVALWKYAVAAAGCALGDILGNDGQPIIAALIFVALIPFCLIMLQPFKLDRFR